MIIFETVKGEFLFHLRMPSEFAVKTETTENIEEFVDGVVKTLENGNVPAFLKPSGTELARRDYLHEAIEESNDSALFSFVFRRLNECDELIEEFNDEGITHFRCVFDGENFHGQVGKLTR